MAEDYLAILLEVIDKPAYRLLGWSFGGAVAFELARRLQSLGKHIDFVALLDTPLPSRIGSGLCRAGSTTTPTGHCSADESERSKTHDLVFGRDVPNTELDSPSYLRYLSHSRELLAAYRPNTFRGTVICVRAARSACNARPVNWNAYVTGRYLELDIDADHDDLMRPSHLKTICSLLKAVVSDPKK
jgi:nonribosomal peptide synthetase DhbF